MIDIDKSRDKLNNIHNKLIINYGNKYDEYPEQLMSAMFINSDDVVLEIGGNIGRNSCVIASLLEDSNNLLVVESDPDFVLQLTENKNINSLNFKIECSAISNNQLIQQGWDTKYLNTDIIPDGWKKINSITFDELKQKYNMSFNVLVVDCEGALYFILKENPNFLNGINTVIIENDFSDFNHKCFVDTEFKRYDLKPVFRNAGGFGPCYNCFYEVWKK